MNSLTAVAARGLTNEELEERAPAIFAGAKSPDASDRYSMVRTIDVVDVLRGSGFVPVLARQTGAGLFGRHMVRFRHETTGVVVGRKVGSVLPEVVLLNAHDRSSSYRLLAGLFRLVCENGLVVADALIGEARVLHVGNAPQKVLEMSRLVLEGSVKAVDVADRWSGAQLTDAARLSFAEGALALRFEEDKSPIAAQRLLDRRRHEDEGRDLWTTFNVVQENLMRGGQSGRSFDDLGVARRVKTRPVKAIAADLALNRGLWSLAERVYSENA